GEGGRLRDTTVLQFMSPGNFQIINNGRAGIAWARPRPSRWWPAARHCDGERQRRRTDRVSHYVLRVRPPFFATMRQPATFCSYIQLGGTVRRPAWPASGCYQDHPADNTRVLRSPGRRAGPEAAAMTTRYACRPYEPCNHVRCR